MTQRNRIDTRFRSALERMARAGRLAVHEPEIDPHLEVASLMKAHDGREALIFPHVKGFDAPVVGNLLSCAPNCEAAFGLDFRGIRGLVARAMGNPLEPEVVSGAPAQDVVHTEGIDLGRMLPVLHHAPSDGGRFITAGVVIVRDPETGIYNASYHRLQLLGPDRTGIKLDFGRHLRLAFERAQKRGETLPITVALGTDLALHYTAATMGSQMPETADELAVAGGLAGQPLAVTRAVTQDLLVPAESEYVLEGEILAEGQENEGPFGEFVGFSAPAGPSPVFRVTALTHRNNPIYHAINGYGRETVMLRKYVLEASLLKAVQPAVPIVVDAEMTAGGMHRFHAVIQVRKELPQHDGLQRNAILAAFGALKDLDMIIVVDDDIDIRDQDDVEYALATRMEASRDLFTVPGARGHEYVRVSDRGMRTKLGLDATVPFEERERFTRVRFSPCDVDITTLSTDLETVETALGLPRDGEGPR